MQSAMRIGRVSECTGLSIDAIRFYEKQRLLNRAHRTEGGFRLFDLQDIERIRFIRRVQQLGFSLPEIRELLALQNDHAETCSHVRDLLQTKMATVREKIRELRVLERQMVSSLRKCDRNLTSGRNCRNESCPVLRDALAKDTNES